jgi:hypothetical protein
LTTKYKKEIQKGKEKTLTFITKETSLLMPKQYNVETKARSRGLVVRVEGSRPSGCRFQSNSILDGYKKC